jgi:hypothetical protein
VFIVEMQMFWTPAFQQRMPFSASQAYVQQIRPGRDYRFLQPVYAVGLINDIFDKETADWRHHYKIVNVDKPAREIKGLQFVFVELPKSGRRLYRRKNQPDGRGRGAVARRMNLARAKRRSAPILKMRHR